MLIACAKEARSRVSWWLGCCRVRRGRGVLRPWGPVRHRKEDRIRAHVILCWLALLLIRIAETETEQTWRNLRDELQRIHLGSFTGPAGTSRQRTELTARQRDILRALNVPEPPLFLALTAPEPAGAQPA
jgi:hypothetical protein